MFNEHSLLNLGKDRQQELLSSAKPAGHAVGDATARRSGRLIRAIAAWIRFGPQFARSSIRLRRTLGPEVNPWS